MPTCTYCGNATSESPCVFCRLDAATPAVPPEPPKQDVPGPQPAGGSPAATVSTPNQGLIVLAAILVVGTLLFLVLPIVLLMTLGKKKPAHAVPAPAVRVASSREHRQHGAPPRG